MLKISGKLANGQVVNGTVPTTSFSEASTAAVAAASNANSTLTSLSIKTLASDKPTLKVGAARARKTAAPAAVPASKSKR